MDDDSLHVLMTIDLDRVWLLNLLHSPPAGVDGWLKEL